MKENTSMEAFLDDYGKIVVYLSQRFYNGKSDRFYLERTQGEVTACQIRELESHESYTRYTLTGPADIRMGEAVEIVEEHGHRAVLQFRRILLIRVNWERFVRKPRRGLCCGRRLRMKYSWICV